MKTIDTIDQIDHTINKMEFINTMLGAWNVDEIPLSFSDMAGLQLFMDDIIDDVKRYRDVICPPKCEGDSEKRGA